MAHVISETREYWLRGFLGGLAGLVLTIAPTLTIPASPPSLPVTPTTGAASAQVPTTPSVGETIEAILGPRSPEHTLAALVVLLLGAFLLVVAAGLSITSVRRRRVIAFFGILLPSVALFDFFLRDPMSAFLGGTAIIGILSVLASDPPISPAPAPALVAKGALIPCAATWLLAGPTLLAESSIADLAATCLMLAIATFFAVGATRDPELQRWRRFATLGLAAVVVLTSWATLDSTHGTDAYLSATLCLVFVQYALLSGENEGAPESTRRLTASPLYHPAQLISGTFLFAIVAGTTLLAFPLSAADGHHFSIIDAAFTATSAVCVTGLIVLDTPNDLSLFGQGVLLLLIQVGGLGIMTLSAAAATILGRRRSLEEEAMLGGVFGTSSAQETRKTVRDVVFLTLAAEAIGAVALGGLFYFHGDTIATAAWRGLFTSVSAFCNAGFALQTDSLIPYQASPLVLHVVAILIIAGGLGPVGIKAIPRLIRRRPLDPFPRIIVYTTGALLATSFLSVLAFEWSDALAPLGFVDRLHNAWFQAVTLRTAGFNSIEFVGLHHVTLLVMAMFMFIGGSPGSTAGGIKTTTFAVLILATMAAMRGKAHIEFAKRTIVQDAVYRALASTALGLTSLLVALIALLLTQDGDPIVLAFETVSALGTVGLSAGGTGMLDEFGKFIVMATMFAGRVGPLTLFVLLQGLSTKRNWRLPQADISVG
ncbi:MAG: potassium transporter TrkH [Deltaproteobacteria bacterium]|nr:potassium transporter TrkH [Deltaproteobacteria bacterium]